jgi:hypothetical protein
MTNLGLIAGFGGRDQEMGGGGGRGCEKVRERNWASEVSRAKGLGEAEEE